MKINAYLCIAFERNACHSLSQAQGDSLAQLVEHNTFNVGVVGSSPTRITNQTSQVVEFQLLGLFLSSKLSANCLQIVCKIKIYVNILSTPQRESAWESVMILCLRVAFFRLRRLRGSGFRQVIADIGCARRIYRIPHWL